MMEGQICKVLKIVILCNCSIPEIKNLSNVREIAFDALYNFLLKFMNSNCVVLQSIIDDA